MINNIFRYLIINPEYVDQTQWACLVDVVGGARGAAIKVHTYD
jgi:hypothetical protein